MSESLDMTAVALVLIAPTVNDPSISRFFGLPNTNERIENTAAWIRSASSGQCVRDITGNHTPLRE